MLTANTSTASPHSETPQSQPGLARLLLGLPQDALSKIITPSIKTTLASDLFEQNPHQAQNPARELQLCLLNRSILPQERESYLLKALGQPNEDNPQSDFSSILKPVFTEGRPAPYLPRLLEAAAYANKSIAFNRVIETALQTHTPLPESTYEWVAECGKPEMLDTLLRATQPDLSEKRQKELKKLAKAQKEAIRKYNQLTLPERQRELEDATRLHANEPRQISPFQRLRRWLLGVPPLNAPDENRRQVLALLQTPGINVNALNDVLFTPLHWAVELEHNDIVNALLGARDINVNSLNRFGETPLNLAAHRGQTAVVTELLEVPGIDVNAADGFGRTALHYGANIGFNEIVSALLGAPGINVNAADRYGRTPLHLVLRFWIATEGHTNSVKALLEAEEINVNAADHEGKTPLHLAALRGRNDIVKALLGAPEINVNAADHNGDSPLQLALRERHTDIVNVLRQAGGI
jgi:ankyrin repeat protein